MLSKAAFVTPSWRALQLLTVTSVMLCLVVVYDSWSGVDPLHSRLRISLPSVSGLTFPNLSNVTKGIAAGGGRWRAAHPIHILIAKAEKDFQRKLQREASSLEDAATKYRKRRNRHPPPGFDAWYSFASEKGAVIVEEFWDQIYHDLAPFWGMEAHTLKKQAHALRPRIEIRGGNVSIVAVASNDRIEQWADMLRILASQRHVKLPDMDIPVNNNDEPVLIVPWDVIDTTFFLARPFLPSPSDVVSDYSSHEDIDKANFTFQVEWLGSRLTHELNAAHLGPRPYWSLVQPACHPRSPSRTSPILTDVWHPQGHTSESHSALNLLPVEWLKGSFQGYVGNWTVATDACMYPHIQGLHGAFVAPEGMSAARELFPLFGTSKFSMNNDILLPSPGLWNASQEEEEAEAPAVQWEQKESKLFWRGPATGGRHTRTNWQRFHRHRFVSMLNASQVKIAEGNLGDGKGDTKRVNSSQNFRLLSSTHYQLAALKRNSLADWIEASADVSFTDLFCEEASETDPCPYNSKFYSVVPPSTVKEQANYKYSAVLDGNGGEDGSNDLITKLRSGSVVLRASMYHNWFDSRLWAWEHFVPMDNTLVDLYGIMDYFIGSGDQSSHDVQAEKMAEAGKDWANRVLRKEDMLIYMYRLVLEYSRVLDDKRGRLGWVGDLEEGMS